MKKTLLTAVSVLALAAGAEAKIKTGTHVAISTGYAKNTVKIKGDFANNLDQRKPKNTGGMNLGLQLGHTWAIKEKSFVTASLLAGYNFANVKVGKINGQDSYSYKPRFNFGLGVKGGYAVSDSMNAYLGVNLLREQGHLINNDLQNNIKIKESFTAYTLTPLLGVSGDINEKMSWFVEGGYKFSLKTSKLKKERQHGLNSKNLKGPRGMVANVGVSYHF